MPKNYLFVSKIFQRPFRRPQPAKGKLIEHFIAYHLRHTHTYDNISQPVHTMAPESICSAPDKKKNRVRVVARIRPLSEKEKHAGDRDLLRKLQGKTTDTALVQVNGSCSDCDGSRSSEKRWYELDAVLDHTETQAQVYELSGAQQAVTVDLFDGYNVTILAYG